MWKKPITEPTKCFPNHWAMMFSWMLKVPKFTSCRLCVQAVSSHAPCRVTNLMEILKCWILCQAEAFPCGSVLVHKTTVMQFTAICHYFRQCSNDCCRPRNIFVYYFVDMCQCCLPVAAENVFYMLVLPKTIFIFPHEIFSWPLPGAAWLSYTANRNCFFITHKYILIGGFLL